MPNLKTIWTSWTKSSLWMKPGYISTIHRQNGYKWKESNLDAERRRNFALKNQPENCLLQCFEIILSGNHSQWLSGQEENHNWKVLVSILYRVREKIVNNKRGIVSTEVSFLQDNAIVHKSQIAINMLCDLGFELMKQPFHLSYSTPSQKRS